MNIYNRIGRMKKFLEYRNPKIAGLVQAHQIRNMSDFCNERKSELFSREIVEELFVRDFLKTAMHESGELYSGGKGDPDHKIKKGDQTKLTIEVYTPVYTEEVVKRRNALRPGEYLVTRSISNPLESATIKSKLNKYQSKYPEAKQCLFLFLSDYLSEKCVMRAFYNYYGNLGHYDGALAVFSGRPFCEIPEMEYVAGFFITDGYLHVPSNILYHSEVVFLHNPFCRDEFRLPFNTFNSQHLLQCFIEFFEPEPRRGISRGPLLVRFYQNRYPDWLFLEDHINYCRQSHPYIIGYQHEVANV